jgi:hypothetical protein
MTRAEFGYISMLANCFAAALKKGSVHIGGHDGKTLLSESGGHPADSASNFKQSFVRKRFGAKSELTQIPTHFFITGAHKIGKR